MDSNPIHHPSPAKEWNAHFWITFNFWWLAGLVNGLEPHPQSPSSQRMKCSFLDYVQLLMIGRAGQCTQNPSATPLQPKNEMLIFGLCSTSDDGPGWSMDSNPICNPSPTTKMKCLFLDYVQLLMIGQAGRWTQTPSTTPLQPKKWNAYFWITFNFGWSARLVDGLICHPPPLSTQRMKCSFLDDIQLLMTSWAGQWTQTPSATPLQPKKWNACFCFMFNFWWSAGLVDGLESHLPPLSSQKNEMLIFVLHSTSDDWAGHWTQTPSTCPLKPKKWNAHFWITFNFWWLAGLLHGLEPHLPPLSSQKMKCSFLDYFQFRVINQVGRWTQTPSTTPLQPKNAMLIFGLRSTSDDRSGRSMDSNPICHPSTTKKMKCSFLDYVQLLMIGQAGRRTQTPSATSF